MFAILMYFIILHIHLIMGLQNSKICINCKHFMSSLDSKAENGKCALFIKKTTESEYAKRRQLIDFLVTGKNPPQIVLDYYYCCTARGDNDMCGEKGKRFEERLI